MLGKACKAQVDKGRPWINKDGERKQYWDAKYVMKWDSGEDKVISEADSDEIPFYEKCKRGKESVYKLYV